MDWIQKYALLLADYSLFLKDGDHVLVRTTTLAEPLVKAFYKEAVQRGAKVDVEFSFEDQESILLQYGTDTVIKQASQLYAWGISHCNALLTIRAPHFPNHSYDPSEEKMRLRQDTMAPYDKIYFDRLGNGSLKRCLCQYPTHFNAFLAGMDLEEYTRFVQQACFLNEQEPASKWLEISEMQARLVAYLNQVDNIIYRHPDFEISFSVKGRRWINSDGKSNMPSGEVFTSPIEDSVNGEIYFSLPTYFMQQDIEGIRLRVKNGEITSWSAAKGAAVLDKVFAMPGTRFFGEAAIGTNPHIRRTTKNILFDEKIGGTVHMAIGQSYKQCGGKNESPIHWDMITDMTNGGKIIADGRLIYENGVFLI